MQLGGMDLRSRVRQPGTRKLGLPMREMERMAMRKETWSIKRVPPISVMGTEREAIQARKPFWERPRGLKMERK